MSAAPQHGRLRHARSSAMPVIGYLGPISREFDDSLTAFRQSLKETGYVEGQNVAIEYPLGAGPIDRLPALAEDLVHRQVAVIVTPAAPPAFAAKAATSTIPIVFVLGIDPVQSGLVASLNRPGGNVTGVANLTAELAESDSTCCTNWCRQPTAVALLVNPDQYL